MQQRKACAVRNISLLCNYILTFPRSFWWRTQCFEGEETRGSCLGSCRNSCRNVCHYCRQAKISSTSHPLLRSLGWSCIVLRSPDLGPYVAVVRVRIVLRWSSDNIYRGFIDYASQRYNRRDLICDRLRSSSETNLLHRAWKCPNSLRSVVDIPLYRNPLKA